VARGGADEGPTFVELGLAADLNPNALISDKRKKFFFNFHPTTIIIIVPD
jgi:hypothetical protein